jgi:hypothetical protein
MRKFIVPALLALIVVTGCGEAGKLSTDSKHEQAAQASTPEATPTVEATPEATPEDTDETTTEVKEANVFIKQKGFTQVEDSIYMGAILKNNGTAGAADVEVTLNALDSNGDVVATETADVAVIPAGETFNVGMDTMVDGENVKSIEVYADVDDSASSEYGVPTVTRPRVQHESYDFMDGGNTNITAQVRNNMDEPLSSLANMYVVMFNANGKVIGGAHTYPDRDIRPNRRASISFPITDFLPEVTKVAVSADNEVSFG